MREADKSLEPWEVPPDESYWRALLEEGECYEDKASIVEEETKQDALALPSTATSFAVDLSEEEGPHGQEDDSSPWDIVVECQKTGKPITLRVTGYNRGGLLVDWDGLTGFVPASQISVSLPYGDEVLRREVLAARVGDMLTLQVVESDPSRNRLILSERASLRQQEPNSALWNILRPGDVCRGQVTNLCAFGAFIDLGGIEGLIHISELSWGHVSHPADVLQSGQEVDVYILNVSPEQQRIGLSLKRLKPDPWDAIEERYQVGQTVEGTVTSIVSFGAFVRVEEGLEGLIHVSELRDNASSFHNAIREGQIVQVQIMNIDGVQHRMGLSLIDESSWINSSFESE